MRSLFGGLTGLSRCDLGSVTQPNAPSAARGGPRDNAVQAAIVSMKREFPRGKRLPREKPQNTPLARRTNVIGWEAFSTAPAVSIGLQSAPAL